MVNLANCGINRPPDLGSFHNFRKTMAPSCCPSKMSGDKPRSRPDKFCGKKNEAGEKPLCKTGKTWYSKYSTKMAENGAGALPSRPSSAKECVHMSKEKVLLNDFRSYRFLSELKYAPDGSAAAMVVSQANEENGYDSCIWVYRPQTGFSQLTAQGKEKNLLWLDSNTILFVSQRDSKKKKQAEQGEELTSFYRIPVDGGEAIEMFTVPLKVNSLKPIKDTLYLLTATVDNARPDLSGKTDEEKARLIAQYEKEKKAWQVIDELPYWSNGRHFTNKLRHRLYLFDIESQQLTPVSAPMADVMEAHPSSCGKYIAYTAKEYQHLMPLKNTLYLYQHRDR